jgi:hypothetical protein
MRQTDVVHFPQDLVHAPVGLRKRNALINIGKRVWFQLSNPIVCLLTNGWVFYRPLDHLSPDLQERGPDQPREARNTLQGV